MKKLLTTAAMALTVATAQAEIYVSSEGMTISSSTYYNVRLLVSFNDSCDPYFGMQINLPGKKGRNETARGRASLRVDNRPIRKAGYIAKTFDGAQLLYMGTMTDDMGTAVLNDMRLGVTLRVTTYDNSGNARVDSYNLMGFTRAFNQLKANCEVQT